MHNMSDKHSMPECRLAILLLQIHRWYNLTTKQQPSRALIEQLKLSCECVEVTNVAARVAGDTERRLWLTAATGDGVVLHQLYATCVTGGCMFLALIFLLPCSLK